MRITFFLLFFTSLLCAQHYDLVVTSNLDSIACHIKNITEDTIHFEMKANYNWIDQAKAKNQLIEYSNKSINKYEYTFKKGTTIILSKKKPMNPQFGALRNSVYVSTLGVNYARILPIKDRFGLNLGAGISFLEGGFMTESTLLWGGPRYYFEAGVNFLYLHEVSFIPLLQAGFRYQNPKGFLLRIAPMYANLGYTHHSYITIILPYLSLGYSF